MQVAEISAVRNGCKELLEKHKRCKIIDIQKFKEPTHWVVDRWWNHKERIELGIVESRGSVKKIEISKLLEEFNNTLEEYKSLVQK